MFSIQNLLFSIDQTTIDQSFLPYQTQENVENTSTKTNKALKLSLNVIYNLKQQYQSQVINTGMHEHIINAISATSTCKFAN